MKSDDRLPVVGRDRNPAWTIKHLPAPGKQIPGSKSKFPILNGLPRGGGALRLQWNFQRPATARGLLHLRSRHPAILQTDPESHGQRQMRRSSHDHFHVPPSSHPGRDLLPVRLLRAITNVRQIAEDSDPIASSEPTSNLTGSGHRRAQRARGRGTAG